MAMHKLWPLFVVAGGAMVLVAFIVWFDDADCGSDRDCGYLVGLAMQFWTLLVLGIAIAVVGFVLRSRHKRHQG